MGKNVIQEEFSGDGSWVCPGGVTQVKARAVNYLFSQIDYSAGLDSSGYAYRWGGNGSGELGNGTVTPRSSPVAVIGGLKFRQISCSSSGTTTLALAIEGSAYAWGSNEFGGLGVGDVIPRSSPVAVLGGLKFRQVIAGNGSSGRAACVAISIAGDAYGWGNNDQGCLGVGDNTNRSSPVAVVGGFKFQKISIGNGGNVGVLALAYDNSLYGWGSNSQGQLGLGDLVSRSSPVAVLGGLKFRFISSGSNMSAAIDLNGNLYMWGANASGQLGDGTVVGKSSPVAVLGGLKFRSVSCGSTSVLAITENGNAYAWGVNTSGQLGVGDVIPRSSPVAVLGGFTWAQASLRGTSAFAIRPDGSLYAWGINGSGSLGLGDLIPRSSPVAVLGGIKWQAVTEAQSNEVTIPVVPGESYTVTAIGLIASFGAIPLYQDPYNSGSIPTKIIVEYEA